MDDVILQKAASLERCIRRVHEDFDDQFEENLTKQDAVILNLQRACQLVIDMAAHYVRVNKLGVPDSSAAVFQILHNEEVIDKDLSNSLISMVGFRNVAIHEYQELDFDIVRSIIAKDLKELARFSSLMVKMT